MTTITFETIQFASFKDLKAFAVANDIQIDGDKRKKVSFVESIEAWLIECGEMEAAANQAGIDSGSVSDFINISEHIDSTIQQPELEHQAKEIANVSSEVVKPVNAKFREGSTVITMFAPLAMLLGAVIVASVWLTIRLAIVLKPVMQYCLRLIDRGLTAILEAIVYVIEYCFGDSPVDDYSHDMQELIHLI